MLKYLSKEKNLQYFQVLSFLWKQAIAKKVTELFISLLENRMHSQKMYLLPSFFSLFLQQLIQMDSFPLDNVIL